MRNLTKLLFLVALLIPASALLAQGDPPLEGPCKKCAFTPSYYCGGGYSVGIDVCPPSGCAGNWCGIA